MNELIKKEIANEINEKLLDWFKGNKRDLIFRKDKDPYKIWISEIMAQQTQIKTLIPFFERFINRFPDIESLSQAQEEDILKLWEGLGYYSRAKNILKTAQILKGKSLPSTYSELIKLPGIGSYTAGAIASISHNERVPAIDGNVLRVISRIYGSTEDISLNKTKSKFWDELKETMPQNSGDYNESLMELGALICTPKNPSCLICPVKENCISFKKGLTEVIPIKNKKQKKETISNEAVIIFKNGNPLYLKREDESLLKDLYGFPIKEKKEKGIETLVKKYQLKKLKYLGTSKHIFTHKIWETDVYRAETEKELSGFTDSPPSVPTAFKKMLKLIDHSS